MTIQERGAGRRSCISQLRTQVISMDGLSIHERDSQSYTYFWILLDILSARFLPPIRVRERLFPLFQLDAKCV